MSVTDLVALGVAVAAALVNLGILLAVAIRATRERRAYERKMGLRK